MELLQKVLDANYTPEQQAAAAARAARDADAADLQIAKDDAVRDLLDALAHPDGRCVARAWDRMTMLYGRTGDVMMRAAFEQYLDELADKRSDA